MMIVSGFLIAFLFGLLVVMRPTRPAPMSGDWPSQKRRMVRAGMQRRPGRRFTARGGQCLARGIVTRRDETLWRLGERACASRVRSAFAGRTLVRL
jgi:hypothetical protein